MTSHRTHRRSIKNVRSRCKMASNEATPSRCKMAAPIKAVSKSASYFDTYRTSVSKSAVAPQLDFRSSDGGEVSCGCCGVLKRRRNAVKMNNDRRLALIVAIAIAVVFVVFLFNFSPLLLFVAAAICILICFSEFMCIDFATLGLNRRTSKSSNNKCFLRTRPNSSIYKPPMASCSSSAITRGSGLWGKSINLNNFTNVQSPLAYSKVLDGGGTYLLARRRLEAARRSLPQVAQTQVSRHGSVLASVMNTKMFQERLQVDGPSPPQRHLTDRVTVRVPSRVLHSQPTIISLTMESTTVPNRSVAEALRMKRKIKTPASDLEECPPSEKRECREGPQNPPGTLPNGLVGVGHGAEVDGTARLHRQGISRKRAAVVTPWDGVKLAKRTRTNEILCSYSSSRRVLQRVKGRTRTFRTEPDVPVTTDNETVDTASSTFIEDDPVDAGTVPEKEVEVNPNEVRVTTNNLHRSLPNAVDSASKGTKSRKQRLGIYEAIKSPHNPDGVYVPSYLAGVEDHVRDGLAARKRLSALMGTKSPQVTVGTNATALTAAGDPPTPVKDTLDVTPITSSPVTFSVPPPSTTTSSSSIGGFSFGFATKSPETSTENSSADNMVKPLSTSTVTIPSSNQGLMAGHQTNPVVSSMFGTGSETKEKVTATTSASGNLANTFGVPTNTPLVAPSASLGPHPETLFQFGTTNPTSTTVTFSNGTRTSPMSSSSALAPKTTMDFNFCGGDGGVQTAAPAANQSGPFIVGDGTGGTGGTAQQPFSFGGALPSADSTQSGGYSFNFGVQPTFQFGWQSGGGDGNAQTMFSTGTGSTMPRRRRQVGTRPRSHR